ncbi:MAG: fused MFS/spermidine synthase [Myxococcota bacterium]
MDPRLARILYGCFIVSGAAGLIYEVIWSALLSNLVGGTTTTHTVVLAAFMGGLALGNRFGGRWADTGILPLRLYAYLETAVGILGVLSPQLADLAGAIYVSLAPDPSGAFVWLDSPLRLALAMATILPASFAMGATMPALVRACTTRLGGLGASVGWLYFINSAGAAVGALMATFYVIPKFGLDLGLILVGTSNLLLALLALGLSRRVHGEQAYPAADAPHEPGTTGRPSEPEDAPALQLHEPAPARVYTRPQVRAALDAVFLSGIATMLIELVWTRILALTMGGSAHAFAIMLATFIAGIALGGVVAARIAKGDRDVLGPLLIAEGIAVLSLVLLFPWYDRLPFAFHGAAALIASKEAAYPVYLAVCTAMAILAMLGPTIAFGATLPLASRVVTSAIGQAGRSVGGVFSTNTLGNVIGAAAGGLTLVPLVGLEWTLRIGALLVALATLRLAVAVEPGSRLRRFGLSACGLAALMTLAVPGWDPLLLHSGLYRSLEHDVGSVAHFRATSGKIDFLFEEDDEEATVSVIENANGHRLLRVNGKSDAGNHRDVPTQVLVGQLPFFFHADAKRVLVVGLGSGITVGAVLAHPVEHVDVIEISPAIVNGSRYFDEWSHAPLDDPRVTLHVRDARNFLRVLPEDVKYDVIVSEPSNPWQPGSAALFSQEYYEQLKDRLAPGGVMSQWVHTYEMDESVLDVILRTYAQVFERPRIWSARGNDMVMVAAATGDLEVDFDRMAKRLALPKVASEMRRVTPDDRTMTLDTLLMHEVMAARQFRAVWGSAEEQIIHTDRIPVLQYIAPKAFFVGANAKAFRRRDARQLPRERGDLLLARRLGSGPLPLERLLEVDDYFAARDFKIDEGVASAVALRLAELRPENLRHLERLADLDLLSVPTERKQWAMAAERVGDLDKTQCLMLIAQELRRVTQGTSIFTSVSLDGYLKARTACIERFPDLDGSTLRGMDQRASRYAPETGN